MKEDEDEDEEGDDGDDPPEEDVEDDDDNEPFTLDIHPRQFLRVLYLTVSVRSIFNTGLDRIVSSSSSMIPLKKLIHAGWDVKMLIDLKILLGNNHSKNIKYTMTISRGHYMRYRLCTNTTGAVGY